MNNLTSLKVDYIERKQVRSLDPITFIPSLYFIPNKDKIQSHI